MNANNFHGIYSAMITPFLENGNLDEQNFRNFLRWQISEGIRKFIISGTTGESPTLSHEEHILITKWAVEEKKKSKEDILIIAGTGSNSTKEAIDLSEQSKDLGVDGLLVVTPYYNKPSQNHIFKYYKKIHDSVDLPIILYNIPGRCIVDISLDLLRELAKLKNIIGIKDAVGNPLSPVEIKDVAGADFTILTGDDGTAYLFYLMGGHGLISVTSNIAPKQILDIYNNTNNKDLNKARESNLELYNLNKILFSETNPIPIKYAVSLLKNKGFDIKNILRSPLFPISKDKEEQLKDILIKLQII